MARKAPKPLGPFQVPRRVSLKALGTRAGCAGLFGVRLHDLRHTHASFGAGAANHRQTAGARNRNNNGSICAPGRGPAAPRVGAHCGPDCSSHGRREAVGGLSGCRNRENSLTRPALRLSLALILNSARAPCGARPPSSKGQGKWSCRPPLGALLPLRPPPLSTPLEKFRWKNFVECGSPRLQRTSFGTRGSQVQILPLRPILRRIPEHHPDRLPDRVRAAPPCRAKRRLPCRHQAQRAFPTWGILSHGL